MNPILAGIALAVVAGAVVAVASRDARAAILGLAVALIGSPVLAEPLPTPLGLATRFVGAVLAAYLLWVVARDRPQAGAPSATTGGSHIGWPAEVLVAAAAAVVGFAAHGLGAPALGPMLASAAGFAVAAARPHPDADRTRRAAGGDRVAAARRRRAPGPRGAGRRARMTWNSSSPAPCSSSWRARSRHWPEPLGPTAAAGSRSVSTALAVDASPTPTPSTRR